MKQKSINVKFWIYYHLGILVFSALVAMMMKYLQVGHAFPPEVIVPFITIFMMTILIGYMAIFVIRKYEGLTSKQLSKKILPGLILFYVAAFIIVNLTILLGNFVWFLVKGFDLATLFENWINNELGYASIRLLFWLLVFTVAFFYILWQRSSKREQALIEEKLRYRYQNLKAQVNPHFLFNSLNTLSELVYEDAARADDYIQRLSEIYRYVLENEETEWVPLENEIEFVKNYVELQKSRNGEKILLDVDISHPGAVLVVPVSLQSLVENAIKHNISSNESPLKIKIRMRAGTLVVSNNLQRKNILKSSGTGLANLKQRVSLLLGKELKVLETDKAFTVELPVKESKP